MLNLRWVPKTIINRALGIAGKHLCTSSTALKKLNEENRPKMISAEALSNFKSILPQVVQDLMNLHGMKKLPDTNQWLGEMLPKLMAQGEYFRAQQIISLNSFIHEGDTEKTKDLILVNGWFYEMGHRGYTILGDMMEGIERKGEQLTWHIQNNHGLAAVSDGLITLSSSLMLQQLHFGSKPYYKDLVNLRNFCYHSMLYGKSRGLRSARNREFDRFDMNFYTHLKTMTAAYDGIYGPVSSVLIINGLQNPKLGNQIKRISEELGVVHSSKVDMYGAADDPEKCDRDIADGNCTWQFVTAMELGTSGQRNTLKVLPTSLYGTSEVSQVKELYKDLQLKAYHQSWEEMKTKKVIQLLDQLEDERLQSYFLDFIASTFGYRI